MKALTPFATDLDDYFDRLWNAAAGQDTSRYDEMRGGRVRIECTGESIELDALGVAVVRKTASDLRYVEFVCPRCNLVHESPWLRS
jgi:hypothetical protein